MGHLHICVTDSPFKSKEIWLPMSNCGYRNNVDHFETEFTFDITSSSLCHFSVANQNPNVFFALVWIPCGRVAYKFKKAINDRKPTSHCVFVFMQKSKANLKPRIRFTRC